jgi:hypothetical protein
MPLLSLLGGGLGGLLRFVPEIFKLINAKGDRDHEFRMSQLQLQVDKARSEQEIDKLHAQSEAADALGQINLTLEAIKSQGQLTGVKFVDALNSLVRPLLTFWWMAIFTAFKITVIVDAWYNFASWKTFGQQVWTENDWVVLSGIISFWFVDRAIRKQQK